MKRWLSCILIFSIASAGIDAATDAESLGPCDEQVAHEAHSDHGAALEATSDPTDPAAPNGDNSVHFCHCGLHAPALLSSAEPGLVPASEPSPSVPTSLCGTHRSPPPVRPPKSV
ncbi:MAG TPA: hypothetical protein VF339_16475 [Gammaproteobacteria bacterium]